MKDFRQKSVMDSEFMGILYEDVMFVVIPEWDLVVSAGVGFGGCMGVDELNKVFDAMQNKTGKERLNMMRMKLGGVKGDGLSIDDLRDKKDWEDLKCQL